MNRNHAFRTGASLDIGTAPDDRISFKNRIGYQYDYPAANKYWKLYAASDVSFYYSASNFQSNKTIRYGLTPIVGISYYISPCFSLSTELGLNLFYTQFRKPDSFDSKDNYNAFEANIGSAGMIVAAYHFNLKKK